MSDIFQTRVIGGENPSPLSKIFTRKFKQAVTDSSYVALLTGMKGCFAMASTTDAQKISIHLKPGEILVEPGISRKALITIHLDLNNPASAKVEGLLKHPFFAIKVGKLLEFPETDWQTAAKDFWQKYASYQGMPASIKVTCTTTGREVLLGKNEGDIPDVSIQGEGTRLAEVFTGDTVIAEAALGGKINVDSSLQHLVVLSDLNVQMLLGDIA